MSVKVFRLSSHLNEVLGLLRKLMEYRSSEVRHRLEEVGRAALMLHVDVLLLIYHFARFGGGNILKIAGLFILDAHNNVRRELDCYGDLLDDGC